LGKKRRNDMEEKPAGQVKQNRPTLTVEVWIHHWCLTLKSKVGFTAASRGIP